MILDILAATVDRTEPTSLPRLSMNWQRRRSQRPHDTEEGDLPPVLVVEQASSANEGSAAKPARSVTTDP
jgi:hypothetical protein